MKKDCSKISDEELEAKVEEILRPQISDDPIFSIFYFLLVLLIAGLLNWWRPERAWIILGVSLGTVSVLFMGYRARAKVALKEYFSRKGIGTSEQ